MFCELYSFVLCAALSLLIYFADWLCLYVHLLYRYQIWNNFLKEVNQTDTFTEF